MQDCWSFTCCFSWTLGSSSNCSSWSLFYRYYFGRCSSELPEAVPLPYSRGRPTRYSDRLHDFSVAIPKCNKDVYVKSFFLPTATLRNYLPIECFPMTYELSGFKSRINRHLLTVSSFKTDFLYALTFLCFFFLYLHASWWLFSLAWSESHFEKNEV